MYSWDGDTSGWYGSRGYKYGLGGSKKRSEAASRAAAHGPRSYEAKSQPVEKVVDPSKRISSSSRNPLVIAVDVTGSMASWPFEIFDRLPLLYNTLSQYRQDLEICFAAIGDAGCDRWPLQVTQFAGGFDLEQLLGSLHGEGGGGDAPESYGLFAHWLSTHVEVPNVEEPPFLIIYGDITMHPTVPAEQIKHYLGDTVTSDVDAIEAWNTVGETWNTWFLCRSLGSGGQEVHAQWGRAVGEQKILPIEDEQRAVDYAMGLIARAWGRFGDFKDNMRARQSEEKVAELIAPIEMKCPRCGSPIPLDATGIFGCRYCGATLRL